MRIESSLNRRISKMIMPGLRRLLPSGFIPKKKWSKNQ